METPSNSGLTRRDRTLLDRARLNGYLDTDRGSGAGLLRAHGFWCWKLRIPLVCFDRNSPRSRFGSVRLDLFTTPHQLTDAARAELASLPGIATITPYDAVWRNVPKRTSSPSPAPSTVSPPAAEATISGRLPRRPSWPS